SGTVSRANYEKRSLKIRIMVVQIAGVHYKPSKRCMLWEEPEVHLHPGAQDILLSEIEKRIGNRILFMTTHSPVFIRPNPKIAVHTISNINGRNGTGRTLLEGEFHEAISILGSRPGHLAQADIVLYVEGKHGVSVVEEWLEKWPDKEAVLEHLQLVVQSLNVSEAGTDDFNLGSLKKVTPHMVMFVDKDNEPGETEPTKSRQILERKCTEENVPFIITKKRQIEDYFTEEAVRAGLPSNLRTTWEYNSEKPIGENWPNGWKKHNRRIAANMKWEDISKHEDIMQIFDEIKTCAQRLMP
ncbi:MAG: ATP-binding protein, partial [Sedimentisphaerales bacterium]|nr:ATP-binding protein [Sedimentisphaerales bacterium]